MTDVKLTPSQREVLKKVAKDGPCETTVRTSFGRVSGTSAAALVRKGLLRYKGYGIQFPTYKVELTDEGRKVAASL